MVDKETVLPAVLYKRCGFSSLSLRRDTDVRMTDKKALSKTSKRRRDKTNTTGENYTIRRF
jgi:hypothetical protein